MLKLAAIDIGSNAIRLQLTRVTIFEGVTTFKRLEYVRFPMRLGQDVFSLGRISEASKQKFIKLMEAFKILIDLYEVDDYMGCATSAMRESENGHLILKEVEELIGLQIEVIDGDREAEIINKAIFPHMGDHTHLHIDVGGGSTELNLYVNNRKIKAKSFTLGSVRRLQESGSLEIWDEMKRWIQQEVKKEYGKVTAIGTGGNINKVLDLAGKKPGKAISLYKIIETQDYIRQFSMEDRINKLQLNPDRADVIIPALDIYITAMKWAKASSIIVPNSGLKDGIMQILFERYKEKMR
jgi:exopolyphosphatase/guanosine-5'-triphosphate,3'-diphosphate pyrophosphatase